MNRAARRDREPEEQRRAEADRRHHHDAERIEHLHIAAEHLRHAGLHDVAGAVMNEARELEQNLQGHARGPEAELRHMIQEMREQFEMLTRQVDSLRREVRGGGER